MNSISRRKLLVVAITALFATPMESVFAQDAVVAPTKSDAALPSANADDPATSEAAYNQVRAKAKELGFPFNSGGVDRIDPKGDGQFHIANERAYMDFDKNGQLVRGEIKAEDGHTTARWDGPPGWDFSPPGGTRVVKSNGDIETTFESGPFKGSRTVVHPDGSYENFSEDGGHEVHNKDGSWEKTEADGSRIVSGGYGTVAQRWDKNGTPVDSNGTPLPTNAQTQVAGGPAAAPNAGPSGETPPPHLGKTPTPSKLPELGSDVTKAESDRMEAMHVERQYELTTPQPASSANSAGNSVAQNNPAVQGSTASNTGAPSPAPDCSATGTCTSSPPDCTATGTCTDSSSANTAGGNTAGSGQPIAQANAPSIVISPDGTRTTTYPDGWQIVITPDGKRTVKYPDGTTLIPEPDCSSPGACTDSSSTNSAGNTVGGQPAAQQSNAAPTAPSATHAVTTPDGTQTITFSDGTQMVTTPDGTRTTTYRDGFRIVTTRAEAEANKEWTRVARAYSKAMDAEAGAKAHADFQAAKAGSEAEAAKEAKEAAIKAVEVAEASGTPEAAEAARKVRLDWAGKDLEAEEQAVRAADAAKAEKVAKATAEAAREALAKLWKAQEETKAKAKEAAKDAAIEAAKVKEAATWLTFANMLASPSDVTTAQIGTAIRDAASASIGTTGVSSVVPPVVPPSIVSSGLLLPVNYTSNFGYDNQFLLPVVQFTNRTDTSTTVTSTMTQGVSGVVAAANTTQIGTFDPVGIQGPGIPLNVAALFLSQNFDPQAGYLDSPTTLTGTVPYNLVASSPPTDSLGRTGVLNAASLSANFTSQSVATSVDLTVAGQQWLMNAPSLGLGGAKFSGQSFQALSGTASNGITVTKVGCATCILFGAFDGGFVLQNYAGALLGYTVNEATTAGGTVADTITGNTVFQRSTVVANAAPHPTGHFYLLINGTLIDASAVTTNAGGALTGFTMGGGATTSQVSFGGTAAVTGTALGGAVTSGTWSSASGLSQITQTTTTVLAPNAAVATYSTPLATASNLVPALTGTASYTLASSSAPTTPAGVAGTLNSASFAVDFGKQTFSTSLNATIGGNIFAATANNGTLGNNGQLSFFNFGIAATKNGTSLPFASLQLNGALGGDTLAGAGYAYAFSGGSAATSFNGSATFTGPAQALNTTAFRDVLTSSHINLFGGFLSVSGMANPAASATVNAQNQLTSYIAPIDPSSFAVAPTIVSARSAPFTTFADTGMDAVTGLIWGRITGQVGTQDRALAGAASGTNIAGSIHYIASAATSTPTTYPLSGVFTYNLVGNTMPTDNQGNVGTLNSATLQADFTNLTAAASVNATVAGTTLSGTTTDARITNSGFLASNGKAIGNFAVSCTGTCGTINTGSLQGVFTGAGAIGAAIAYGMNTAGTGGLNKTISGVGAFRR